MTEISKSGLTSPLNTPELSGLALKGRIASGLIQNKFGAITPFGRHGVNRNYSKIFI